MWIIIRPASSTPEPVSTLQLPSVRRVSNCSSSYHDYSSELIKWQRYIDGEIPGQDNPSTCSDDFFQARENERRHYFFFFSSHSQSRRSTSNALFSQLSAIDAVEPVPLAVGGEERYLNPDRYM